ncbi:probable tRNA (uracil-O(2)-)-methyltransferase [Pieris rapae]|uniref:probable tRNA (uracil-O(2)-)-methyltransferase n=1 Tax=Pieris rapae TaxID=64459 RepID=UPI001E27EFB4|nr:probable tRNA (uracil-O(2)-)-methyltransferase [Pieris rapae]
MDIICETISKCTVEGFWKSTRILISKPHVVNKRLWGSKILLNMEYKTNLSNSHFYQQLEDLKINNSCAVKQFYERLMITLDQLNLKNKLDTNLNSTLECLVVELLPKNYDENHAYQFIVIDKEKATVSFHDITVHDKNQNLCPNFTYCFSHKANKLILKAFSENSKSISWLKESVFPQVTKWAEEPELDLHKNICKDSLRLISSEKFYDKYNELKIKYGKELVKIWPECTDPSKFVYEDISIATYLLLLWGNTSNTTFVDVGCGNGLLVYILTMEGCKGLGVDVRKRGIWDMYPSNIKLEVCIINNNYGLPLQFSYRKQD